MIPGMNSRQAQQMMKKMGISQVNLPIKRVIFEMEDSNLVIEDPSVTKISMQGQISYQVVGEESEESTESFSKEDVEMVIEKTGKDEGEVREALEKSNGDIAEAIMELS